jgi:hypothetical protein
MTSLKHLHAPIGTCSYSQSLCPQTGIWRPDTSSRRDILKRGDSIPFDGNQATFWTLESYLE